MPPGGARRYYRRDRGGGSLGPWLGPEVNAFRLYEEGRDEEPEKKETVAG
jgi:hypothetical protein